MRGNDRRSPPSENIDFFNARVGGEGGGQSVHPLFCFVVILERLLPVYFI